MLQNFHRFRSTAYLLMAAATVVYLIGLFIPIMEVDAAQYAAIAREMAATGSYLEVFNRGQDYLDKPPLLFWLSALSFKVFGANIIAYKLPSYLFTLLGVYSLYRLARHLYDEETGLLAALMLYTCQAFFLFNNDVRTDTLLTANVIFATWQLVLFVDEEKWKHLLAGSLGVAMAMMAKGPIGAIVPASALFTHLLLMQQWKQLFQWKWLVSIVAVLLLLLPMVYGLYRQFGAAGPKFFFWTQSFGRITGENTWHNDAGSFYFVHVFGWSMLPWTLLSATAFLYFSITTVRKRFSKDSLPEFYSIGGFVLPFIALSLSQYKLPHYIFVVFPFAALFTAAFFRKVVWETKGWIRTFRFSQLIVIAGILSLAVIIGTIWFPVENILLAVILIAGAGGSLWWLFRRSGTGVNIIFSSALAAITVNCLLNACAYPSLFRYEPGRQLAKSVSKEHLASGEVYFFNYASYALEFYTQCTYGYLHENDMTKKMEEKQSFTVVGAKDMMEAISRRGWQPKRVQEADHFHITTLTISFLNPATRAGTLDKIYLAEF